MKIYSKPILGTLLLAMAFVVMACEPAGNDAPVPLSAVKDTDAKGNGHYRPISAYHNKTLAEVRSATARYHRVEAAIADGYVLASPCVSNPAGPGAMGHHFVNNSLVDGMVDPSMPEALVYEPMKNGKLRLVAVEYIVVAAPWDAMHDGPPMLGDQVFDDHRLGGGGPPFPHYQLHAWVWKNNPYGMHASFNPNVTCEYAEMM